MKIFSGKHDELANWPRNAEGVPEKPVFLVHCDCNDLNDEITINMLQAYGIPCLKNYPGDGAFGKVIIGMSGNGTNIYVPESMYEDAVALCKKENDDELV